MMLLYLKLPDYVNVESVYHLICTWKHLIVLCVNVRVELLFDFFNRFFFVELIVVQVLHLQKVAVFLIHHLYIIIVDSGLRSQGGVDRFRDRSWTYIVLLVDVTVLTETRLWFWPGVVEIFLGLLGLLFLEFNVPYCLLSYLLKSLVLRITAMLACESSCRRRISHRSLIVFNGRHHNILKLKGELVDCILVSIAFNDSHGLVTLLS